MLKRPFRRLYDANNSFEKIIALSRQSGPPSVSSSTRPLRAEQPSPVGGSSLAYSDSQGTFRTVHDDESPPPVPQLYQANPHDPHPGNPWGPLPAFPQATHTPPGRPFAPSPVGARKADPDEITPVPKVRGKTNTASVPRHVRFATNNRRFPIPVVPSVPSPPAFSPGRRLTDAELNQREPHWKTEPGNNRPSLLSALPSRSDARTMEEGRLLLNPDQVRRAAMLHEQEDISFRYFCFTAVCPLPSLAFGLGALDWVAKKQSNGRVTEMAKRDKMLALYIATPVNALFWGLLVVSLVVLHAAGVIH
jgi:hypothetical protein